MRSTRGSDNSVSINISELHYDCCCQNSEVLLSLDGFPNSKSRITFALNVFSIVVIQLGIASGLTYLITQELFVSFWVEHNTIFLWMSSLIYFVLEMVWAFIKSVPRMFPWNFLYLLLMTFVSSFIIGCECLSYKDEVPLVAFSLLWTMLQVIICFALFVVNDFTENLLSRIVNVIFGLSILCGQIAYFARQLTTQLVKQMKLVFGTSTHYYLEDNIVIPARNIYDYSWCLILTVLWVYAPFGLRSRPPSVTPPGG
uniref:Uncharacterized protein n=1 Tax=Trichobilharzia regenti TaxID=157069 RepID=A0AA85JLL2_TRIRE|nr:unnamed protein product [Trichobilharzia regenti]